MDEAACFSWDGLDLIEQDKCSQDPDSLVRMRWLLILPHKTGTLRAKYVLFFHVFLSSHFSYLGYKHQLRWLEGLVSEVKVKSFILVWAIHFALISGPDLGDLMRAWE